MPEALYHPAGFGFGVPSHSMQIRASNSGGCPVRSTGCVRHSLRGFSLQKRELLEPRLHGNPFFGIFRLALERASDNLESEPWLMKDVLEHIARGVVLLEYQ